MVIENRNEFKILVLLNQKVSVNLTEAQSRLSGIQACLVKVAKRTGKEKVYIKLNLINDSKTNILFNLIVT